MLTSTFDTFSAGWELDDDAETVLEGRRSVTFMRASAGDKEAVMSPVISSSDDGEPVGGGTGPKSLDRVFTGFCVVSDAILFFLPSVVGLLGVEVVADPEADMVVASDVFLEALYLASHLFFLAVALSHPSMLITHDSHTYRCPEP